MTKQQSGQGTERLLARLSRGEMTGLQGDEALAKTLLARGFIRREGDGFVLTEKGRSTLKSRTEGPARSARKGRRLGSTSLADAHGRVQRVPINLDENPLSRLLRTKDRNGRPSLSQSEYAAGERLRADFTRGQMTPQVTMNWSLALPSRGRGGRGAGDIADHALAARQKVEKAMRSVGPDFGGLLLDVCCFLKGMETIERERGWPVRSAKVAISLALRCLARHYGIEQEASGPADGGEMRHWGTNDYRPRLDAENEEGGQEPLSGADR